MGTHDFSPTLAASSAAFSPSLLAAFRENVWRHYAEQGRELSWRRTRDPYRILVSEVMLQQTQVSRVMEKYGSFLAAFPDVWALSEAPVAAVLTSWQGLGYNRRALSLHRTACIVARDYQGTIPASFAELRALPGVGPATAAAIAAFAFGIPIPFIETNIRSVFLHCFFAKDVAIPDAEILPLVELTLDRQHPREWYYALMDYGAWLKKTHPNPSRRSKHHAAQSPFAGSRRQLRAEILRAVLDPQDGSSGGRSSTGQRVPLSLDELATRFPGRDRQQLQDIADALTREGFITKREGRYQIS